MSITLSSKVLLSLRRLHTVLVHSVPPSATFNSLSSPNKTLRLFSSHDKPSNESIEQMKSFCRKVFTSPAPSPHDVQQVQRFMSILLANKASSEGPDKVEAWRQSSIKEFDIKPPRDRAASRDTSSICSGYNKMILSVGPQIAISAINAFHKSLPVSIRKQAIVSVGSGLARLEFEAQAMNPDIKWICVDPDPTSGEAIKRQPFIRPSHATVDDLIQQDPTFVDDCAVFLNWPLPENRGDSYDYEAIVKLNPIDVLAFIEVYHGKHGASGSPMFHNWLRDSKSGYKLVHEISSVPVKNANMENIFDPRIVWLTRRAEPISSIAHNLPQQFPKVILAPSDSSVSNLLKLIDLDPALVAKRPL